MNLNKIKEYLFIFVGAIIISIGVIVFYQPHDLVTGGVSGLSIVLESAFGTPIWLTSILINTPLFLLGGFVKGKEFFFKSLTGFLSSTLGFYIFEKIPINAEFDLFISMIFGAFCVGAGVGIIFKNQGSSGGTDLAAAVVHKYLKEISVSNILFIIDAVIIVIGIFVFGIEKGLYALIAVYIATRTISYVIDGVTFAKAVHIISNKSDEISEMLLSDLVRGVTGFYGKGMYTKIDKTVLYCVVSPKQVVKLKKLVEKIDENAFIIVTDAKEVKGMGFSKE